MSAEDEDKKVDGEEEEEEEEQEQEEDKEKGEEGDEVTDLSNRYARNRILYLLSLINRCHQF